MTSVFLAKQSRRWVSGWFAGICARSLTASRTRVGRASLRLITTWDTTSLRVTTLLVGSWNKIRTITACRMGSRSTRIRKIQLERPIFTVCLTTTLHGATMKKAKVIKPVVEYTADEVWGAACAAQRILGKYVNATEDPTFGPSRPQSRFVLIEQLTHKLMTDADIEKGIEVRLHFKGLLMKQLAGFKLSDFDTNVLRIATADNFTSANTYDFATLACLPSSYERDMSRESIKEKMANLLCDSSHIGTVGDKVVLDMVVVNSIYSSNYLTNFITGAVNDKNVVFFAYKLPLRIGSKVKVAGHIKQHRDSGQTQLNRVSIKPAE